MNPRFSGGFIFTVFKEIAMKRTTNYSLPTWEKSDFIQMSDFNDLTHKLDTALKSHDDTLNTKADTSAVTAVQQEVAAAREANCLVKLAGPIVTTAANAAMEFDLSQVDMSKVAALFFTFCAGSSSGSMTIAINGTSFGTVCSNSWSTCAGLIWVVPLADNTAFYTALTSNGSGSGGSGVGAVAWESINNIVFSGTSSVGATATLFAVKK